MVAVSRLLAPLGQLVHNMSPAPRSVPHHGRDKGQRPSPATRWTHASPTNCAGHWRAPTENLKKLSGSHEWRCFRGRAKCQPRVSILGQHLAQPISTVFVYVVADFTNGANTYRNTAACNILLINMQFVPVSAHFGPIGPQATRHKKHGRNNQMQQTVANEGQVLHTCCISCFPYRETTQHLCYSLGRVAQMLRQIPIGKTTLHHQWRLGFFLLLFFCFWRGAF